MAWCRSGDKPLSEPMMVNLLTHICVTRPQWVNNVTIFQSTELMFIHQGHRIYYHAYNLESLPFASGLRCLVSELNSEVFSAQISSNSTLGHTQNQTIVGHFFCRIIYFFFALGILVWNEWCCHTWFIALISIFVAALVGLYSCAETSGSTLILPVHLGPHPQLFSCILISGHFCLKLGIFVSKRASLCRTWNFRFEWMLCSYIINVTDFCCLSCSSRGPCSCAEASGCILMRTWSASCASWRRRIMGRT